MIGRKRKQNVKRQADGRAFRERDADPKALAKLMPHRRLVREGVEHDARAESIMGRLCLNGWITEPQYEAGKKYRDIVLRYRAVIDSPRGEVSMSGVIVGPWGGGVVIGEDEVLDRRNKYMKAFEALQEGAGYLGARAVAHCAVYERPGFNVRHAKDGLTALAVHFGLLTKSKNPANAINRR